MKYHTSALKRVAKARAPRFSKDRVRLCGEPGCPHPHYSNNLCNRHRSRVLRTGSPNLKKRAVK